MTARFCNSGSRYFQNAELAKRIFLALDYIEKVQHENGLFDFINCNFYSAPDTAFCIKRALPTYIYLKNHLEEFKKGSSEVQIFERLGKIIKKGVLECMRKCYIISFRGKIDFVSIIIFIF